MEMCSAIHFCPQRACSFRPTFLLALVTNVIYLLNVFHSLRLNSHITRARFRSEAGL